MQTQIAFYDCFYFYVQPVYFTAIISEKFRMRKYHFREFPLQIWQKWIVNKIWIDREKARRDKKGMKRKGFFLSTIRISLSNSTIIYLLQPIRSAYKNTEIVREAQKLKDEKDEEEVSSLLLHWRYWYPIIIMILLWHLFSTNKLFLDCNVNLGTGTQKIILLILKLRTLLL